MEQKYKNKIGAYGMPNQQIMFFKDYETNRKMEFIQMLVHEMLHFNSFNSFKKQTTGTGHDLKMTARSDGSEDENIFLSYRRMGFRVYASDNKTYFEDTDEAIITELSMRFDRMYFSRIPQLAEEYRARQLTIKRAIQELGENVEELKNKWATVEVSKISGGRITAIKNYPYIQQRAGLNQLIDDLYKKNKAEFSSREQVFDLFARASMTGDLSLVARLVEKTFGGGSFKKLDEMAKEEK